MNLREARVYVGTYHKYNGGSIEGEWLDLSDYSDKEEFLNDCLTVHNDEEDPELMFQDRENIPPGLASESHVSERVWEILDDTRDWDDERLEALTVYVEGGYGDWSDPGLLGDFNDAYRGRWDSEKDFAYDYIGEHYDLPKMMGKLHYYFDYEAWARDSFIDSFWRDDATGHVFTR